MSRMRQLLRVLFVAHLVLGVVVIGAILASPPWIIGEGRFNEAARQLEGLDWRWWVLVPVGVLWGLPIVAMAAWLRARSAGLEVERVRKSVAALLQDRQIPIAVDVDTWVPVHVLEPMRVPVELDTRLAVDETVDIETKVPIRTELPLETEIETSVFGIGALKIPIRAKVPIDMVLPVVGKIRVRSDALPVRMKDEVVIRLPPFDVPIRSRIETRVDLLDSLRAAEQELKKRLAKGKEPAGPEDAPPKKDPSST